MWTWSNIPSTGSSLYEIKVCVQEKIYGNFSPVVTMTLTLTDDPPRIDLGCQTTQHLAGQLIDIQMAVGQPECSGVQWSAQLVSGDSSATYSIDRSGVLSFSTAVAGVYDVRVAATTELGSGTCDHVFVVHGTNCCSGTTGNVNNIGMIDLSDLSLLVQYLTGSLVALPCYDAANINGVGLIDVSDLSLFSSYLTGQGGTLPTCP